MLGVLEVEPAARVGTYDADSALADLREAIALRAELAEEAARDDDLRELARRLT